MILVTSTDNTEGYKGHMNNLSFRDRLPAKKGRNSLINILELEIVWKSCPDRQHNNSGLSVEGGRDSLQDTEWSYKEKYVQMLPEWCTGMPRGYATPLVWHTFEQMTYPEAGKLRSGVCRTQPAAVYSGSGVPW